MNRLPPFAGHAPERYRLSIESGTATLPYCDDCARYFYYPRTCCPRCGRADAVDFIQPQENLVVQSLTKIWRPHSPIFESSLPVLILACSIRSDATVIAEGWDWPASQPPIPGDSVDYVVRRTPGRGILAGFVPLNSKSTFSKGTAK